MYSTIRRSALAFIVCTVAACSGGEKKPADGAAGTSGAAPATTGVVHEIIATTDEKGSYFLPREIEARPGDILRVKLAVGVHNVNFLPDSNPGKSGLPASSAYLQLPGQTIDIPLTFGTGKFFFQCDPHAALGMVGYVEVEKH